MVRRLSLASEYDSAVVHWFAYRYVYWFTYEVSLKKIYLTCALTCIGA